MIPNSISFSPSTINFSNDQQEVMRITLDGIKVTPGVSVDDAAKCVLQCLEQHIAVMFAKKDKEIEQLKEQLKYVCQMHLSGYAENQKLMDVYQSSSQPHIIEITRSIFDGQPAPGKEET